MPLTCNVTQSPVVAMARAAWAWVESASSSNGGEKSEAAKMASQSKKIGAARSAGEEGTAWRGG